MRAGLLDSGGEQGVRRMERRLAAIMALDMVEYSRLMEADELGTLDRQKQHRRDVIDPAVARGGGRIVKTTGDGLLAEFGAAQDAVRCALDIQSEMPDREARRDPAERIRFRIGINLGDVIFDEADVFGDGVNVAARLEQLAEPGGLCISDIVHQAVGDRIDDGFRDMGGQRVKNISRPIRVWQWSPGTARQRVPEDELPDQQVRFCTSADGTHIAWSTIGSGLPILRAPHWLNHLEYELSSLFMGPFLRELSRHASVVRFDQRGNGLSDREIDRIGMDAMIEDMEAVVAAAGIDRFALLGLSQGAAFSVRYALRHPERVSCLVLFGGYLRGRLCRKEAEEVKMYEAARMMIREGWGSDLPVYRNFFTSSFLPDAPHPVQDSFDELQRVSIGAENAGRLYEMNSTVDVTEEAAQLDLPVLVIHIAGDRIAPVSEGRLMARTIPGARFVELPGDDHFPTEAVSSFAKFFDAALPFLREHAG